MNTLRFVSALLARPELRSNATAPRTFLPPLLRPILELLSSSGSGPHRAVPTSSYSVAMVACSGSFWSRCPLNVPEQVLLLKEHRSSAAL